MKDIIVLLALACFTLSDAEPIPASHHATNLNSRAFPDSPSGGYAPAEVDCPSTRPTIRRAESLSESETSWLELRRAATIDPMIAFLDRVSIPDFDASSYINDNRNDISALPNIGLAFSGGGWRALQNGAGFLAAADDRTANSTTEGGIGGLLQASTYIAGLSGGGWLVGSVYTNNFSSVTDLRDGDRVWNFENSIAEGPTDGRIQVLDTVDYYNTISDQVNEKSAAGFERSITDYWGRALSFQLVNATDGGPAYTWSSISQDPQLKSGQVPLPILVADGRAPNTLVVSLNSTVFEINPWELGSWDPTLFAFAPLQYIGSSFSGGSIPDSQRCIAGFDQSGFIMGTSSSLFNAFLLNLNSTSLPSFLKSIFGSILSEVGENNDDIAHYKPNPFLGFNEGTSRIASEPDLTLVDGGEDLQNIPLYPLIQPNRQVDVIFAVDSSADTTNNWPNGTAMVATYQRSSNTTIGNGTAFASIPDVNTFVNLGLNNKPTFFGCDPSNVTTDQGTSPLIVYVPNAPYITHSNVSTFDATYNNTQRNAIIQNGYDIATQANGTLDADWTACVGCAILSRSFDRTGTTVPRKCQDCFQKYCWDGTLDSSATSYDPIFKADEVALTKSVGSRMVEWNSMLLVGAAVLGSVWAL